MPKSRGRRKGGKPVRVRSRNPRTPHRADVLLREARTHLLDGEDVLDAEIWASEWFGAALSEASMTDRELEHALCMQVIGRVCSNPSPHGSAALAALARVAPMSERALLSETIAPLTQDYPAPSWHPDAAWTPVAAWRAADVWDSERVLLIEFDGPRPHTVLAQLQRAGGLWVDKLGVLEPGAAQRWDELHAGEAIPMPIRDVPTEEALAELAHALRITDMSFPRNNDQDFLAYRALVWARCGDHLADWPESGELTDDGKQRLVDDFLDETGRDDQATRFLIELFLDYGEGYIIAGPLAWSPTEVMLLLTDWLPRKAVLDAEDRRALPEVLRQWVAFALRRHGIDEQWIHPVLVAVDTHLDEFRMAFDDETAWGPAKQIAAALAERGVDLADRAAVDEAVSALNAERLAQRLRSGLRE